MTRRSIARRYGRAILDVALRESAAEEVERDLGALVDLIEQGQLSTARARDGFELAR